MKLRDPYKDAKCKVCNQYMVQCITANCGCRFCLECALKRKNVCPVCKKKVLQYTEVEEVSQQVRELTFKCAYEKCGFQGTYQQVLEHMSQCPQISVEIKSTDACFRLSQQY